MAGKPLVPSRDALRALRSLAYSPSAALIGTAGAFCGVAAIHYGERQKVHRAERILETKRKLHSISQGRGSARLARMFEAAEKGEDFTINKKPTSKASQRRRQSGLAVSQEQEIVAEWKPFPDVITSGRSRRDPAVNEKPASGPPTKRHADSRSSSSELQPQPDVKETIDEIFKNSSDFWWEKKNWYSSNWNGTRLRRGGVIRRRQKFAPTGDIDIVHFTPTGSIESVLAEQPATDLNPLIMENRHHPSQAEPEDKAERLEASSILLGMDWTSINTPFASLQPWHTHVGSNEQVESTVEGIAPDGGASKLPDLYVAKEAEVPSFEIDHECFSRYNLDKREVRETMNFIGTSRYTYIFANLMNHREKEGQHSAILLLEKIMEQYTMTGELSDFRLAQMLFLDCTRVFTTFELKPMIWRFVEKFLQGSSPKLEVVSFLYPRCGAGVRSEEQHYHFLAHQYLEWVSDQGANLDKQVSELHKVLAGTQLCDIKLHEHIFVPTLRSMCRAGMMTSAQNLFDNFVVEYDIETTAYSRQVLVQGYAKAGKWARVKRILDDHRAEGLSHTQPFAGTGLLISIIDDYALTHSPEKVISFALHCLHEYKLQPVSELTSKIVGLCLRQRRYDLVENWIYMIQTQYPHIEVGSKSSTFAFEVSCVWQEMNASCDDILSGCQAIASHALRDPFSKVFRLVIAEAVHQFLTPRLTQLRGLVDFKIPYSPTGQVDAFYSAMMKLQSRPLRGLSGARAKLMLSYLLSQADRLRWIDALCKGDSRSREPPSDSTFTRKADWSSTPVKVPLLPPIAVVQASLIRAYEHNSKVGIPIEHSALKSTVTQLQQQGRLAHAIDLIQTVYDSRWAYSPTGLDFDLDLFLEWVKLAWKLRSASRLRAVLWAIVDASPQLQLSGQLLLLTRIAAPKTHLQRIKRARLNDIDEMEYLRLRLKRRHWTNAPGHGLQFPEWKGFGRESDSV